MDTIAFAISAILTLLVFSYLLGDNWLFRVAMYIVAGLTAAFTTNLLIRSIIIPIDNTGDAVLAVIALILTALLFARPIVSLTPITNIALAFLVAVGASVAVVGVLTGTLIPLTVATGQAVGRTLLDGLIIAIGVITTLFYFQYLGREREDGTVERTRFGYVLGSMGSWFISITLGALYGTAILTSLTILTQRIAYYISGGA